MRIGVISDTHGKLRQEALNVLQGVDRIIHAGDVGRADILDTLWQIAPVTVVQGNIDRGVLASRLSKTELLTVNGLDIYVLHDLKALDLDPAAAKFRVVVSGHTHQPRKFERKGVWYLNPGSIGPRRFNLPVSYAYLDIGTGGEVKIEIKFLEI
jgi:uncharacterized protein